MSEQPRPDFVEQPLDDVAARVLGALVEKEFTTPDNYPLSLNSLVAACNQSSNRDPVMSLDEAAVTAGLRDLERRTLAREVHRSDSRVKRYRHALTDTLHLHAAEMAALCVLLLRGPQTVGEIRSRTSRMVEFEDLSRVEITLRSLMTLSQPLVAELPRLPGQKEARFAHLLSGEPALQTMAVPATAAHARADAVEPSRVDALEADVAALRAALAELREELDAFRAEFR